MSEEVDTTLSLRLEGGGSSNNVGDINTNNTTTNHHYDCDDDGTTLNGGGETGTRKKLKHTADELNVLEHTFNTQKTIDQDTNTNGDSEAGTRKKLKPTADQLNVLEHTFNRQKTIDQAHKDELARTLNLTPRQVEIWFQNRRARQKQQETGKEYEITKERYEKLMAENRRLKQEKQELLTGFHSPGTTTILHITCPSCANSNASAGSAADHHNLN